MEAKKEITPLKEQYNGEKCNAPGCLMCGNESEFKVQEIKENFGSFNYNFKSKEN